MREFKIACCGKDECKGGSRDSTSNFEHHSEVTGYERNFKISILAVKEKRLET
jgi:hypothetical protein